MGDVVLSWVMLMIGCVVERLRGRAWRLRGTHTHMHVWSKQHAGVIKNSSLCAEAMSRAPFPEWKRETRNQSCSIWVLSPRNGCQLWFTWFKWFLNSFSWHTFMIFIHVSTFCVCVYWVKKCVCFHGCVYRNQRVCLVSLTFTVGDQTCSNLRPRTSVCLHQWHNQDSRRYLDWVETFARLAKVL